MNILSLTLQKLQRYTDVLIQINTVLYGMKVSMSFTGQISIEPGSMWIFVYTGNKTASRSYNTHSKILISPRLLVV